MWNSSPRWRTLAASPITISKAPASWELAWCILAKQDQDILLRYVPERLGGDGAHRPRANLILIVLGHQERSLRAMASMDWDDYLRHEAAMYRQLAEKSENVFGKQELLDLAVVCEEVANSIEDRLTGG